MRRWYRANKYKSTYYARKRLSRAICGIRYKRSSTPESTRKIPDARAFSGGGGPNGHEGTAPPTHPAAAVPSMVPPSGWSKIARYFTSVFIFSMVFCRIFVT